MGIKSIVLALMTTLPAMATEKFLPDSFTLEGYTFSKPTEEQGETFSKGFQQDFREQFVKAVESVCPFHENEDVRAALAESIERQEGPIRSVATDRLKASVKGTAYLFRVTDDQGKEIGYINLERSDFPGSAAGKEFKPWDYQSEKKVQTAPGSFEFQAMRFVDGESSLPVTAAFLDAFYHFLGAELVVAVSIPKTVNPMDPLPSKPKDEKPQESSSESEDDQDNAGGCSILPGGCVVRDKGSPEENYLAKIRIAVGRACGKVGEMHEKPFADALKGEFNTMVYDQLFDNHGTDRWTRNDMWAAKFKVYTLDSQSWAKKRSKHQGIK